MIHQCPPYPRGPPRTPRNLSTLLESMLSPRTLVLPWSWSSAVEGRERTWMYNSPTAGSRGCLGLCSATFEGSWSLEAPWCLWEELGRPPAGRLSPLSIWDSASCQNRGVYHPLPLGCMPTNHTCLRSKACTACNPLPGPSSPPLASLRLPEEGKTRFLLLVLNPL